MFLNDDRAASLTLIAMIFCGALSLDTRDSRAADPAIETLLAEPRFKHAHWGIIAQDLATGEVLYERNSDALFIPASTTKLFSVATALDALGAEHRFVTPLRRRGEVTDGVLAGDLILVASGDPTLGGRTLADGGIAFTNNDHTYANGARDTQLTEPDPLAGLNDLARQVAAAGIRRVRGELIVDDRLFDKAEGSGSGPARVTPIMINDNVVDFIVEPTKPGQPAKVTWRPESAGIHVQAQFDTVESGKELSTWIRDLGHGHYYVHGQIPEKHAKVVRVAEVSDAARHARMLLIEALARAGVVVEAPLLGSNPADRLPSSDEVAKLPIVAKHTSPPLAEEAKLILKVSHNLHASTLPLLVAAKNGERSLAAGLKRQHDFLARAGVDVDTISFGGGAGGARADHTTPRATAQLLKYMAGRPDFAAYRDALPILGVDGTLATAVGPASAARGKAQAKTGTLMWDNLLNGNSLLTSKALAGYLTTAKGRRVAFALFVNNVHLRDGVTTRTVGADLGTLVEALHAGW